MVPGLLRKTKISSNQDDGQKDFYSTCLIIVLKITCSILLNSSLLSSSRETPLKTASFIWAARAQLKGKRQMSDKISTEQQFQGKRKTKIYEDIGLAGCLEVTFVP